ncbi:MAG: hypothetical protein AXA67_02155 [Methylothermaceae bacteria B42]|nr:MAG: hypothetical protein AXA67_02155 [Methylothermaceae bacteria B42]HHJ40065.1 hypothetical protein [Methylothermaceae bacterium]
MIESFVFRHLAKTATLGLDSTAFPEAMAANRNPLTLSPRRVMEILMEHGEDPCTRPQAAAHEAGHWVVGDTLGLSPYRFLRVFKKSRRWLGENQAVDGSSAHVVHEVGRYKKHTLQVIGGYAGELATGFCHPASSLDERVLFLEMCRSLTVFHGGDAKALHDAGQKVVLEIIAARKQDFDRVRRHLERHPRMLRGQLAHLSQPDPTPWLARWEKLATLINRNER